MNAINLTLNFSQFSLSQIASFLNNNQSFSINNILKMPRSLTSLLRNITKDIFYSGKTFLDLKQTISQLSQLKVSKEQLYSGLEKAIIQRLDTVVKTTDRGFEDFKLSDNQIQIEHLDDKIIIRQIMQSKKNKKKYIKTAITEINLTQITDKIYHAEQRLTCAAAQLQQIITIIQSVMAWKCKCQIHPTIQSEILAQQFITYFHHHSYVFTNILGKKTTQVPHFQLKLQTPCIEFSEAVKENKKKKKKKKKINETQVQDQQKQTGEQSIIVHTDTQYEQLLKTLEEFSITDDRVICNVYEEWVNELQQAIYFEKIEKSQKENTQQGRSIDD